MSARTDIIVHASSGSLLPHAFEARDKRCWRMHVYAIKGCLWIC